MKPEPISIAINMTPARALWPNTRAHTRTKQPYKVDLKNAAAAGAINALRGRSWQWTGPILLTVELYWPKGQRRLDFDNAVGALKAAQDGVFDRLDCNDRQIVGMHLTQDWDRIDGTGYMVYTVEAVSEGKAVQAIADSDDSREIKLAELARVRRYVDAAWEQVQEGEG